MWNCLLVCGVTASKQMQEMETPLWGIWFIWSAARQSPFCALFQRGGRTRKKNISDESYNMSHNSNMLFTTHLFKLFISRNLGLTKWCNLLLKSLSTNQITNSLSRIFLIYFLQKSSFQFPLWAFFWHCLWPVGWQHNLRCTKASICQPCCSGFCHQYWQTSAVSWIPRTPPEGSRNGWLVCCYKMSTMRRKQMGQRSQFTKMNYYIWHLMTGISTLLRHFRNRSTGAGRGSKCSSREEFQVHGKFHHLCAGLRGWDTLTYSLTILIKMSTGLLAYKTAANTASDIWSICKISYWQ